MSIYAYVSNKSLPSTHLFIISLFLKKNSIFFFAQTIISLYVSVIYFQFILSVHSYNIKKHKAIYSFESSALNRNNFFYIDRDDDIRIIYSNK